MGRGEREVCGKTTSPGVFLKEKRKLIFIEQLPYVCFTAFTREAS